MSDHIKNMRMVAKRTAAEAGIAFFYAHTLSVALFGDTLPRKCHPYEKYIFFTVHFMALCENERKI